MSSNSSRRPEFRLHFGYPKITLREVGRPEPVAEVDLDDPAIAGRMLALGGSVARAGGRLVAVLPEAEVWRGALELQAGGPRARRAEARGRIAAELRLPVRTLTAVLGASDASGRTAAAAVRRTTLAETRRFLAQARLRPAAIIGDGAFPGFAAAPRLDAPGWAPGAPMRTDLARWLEPALWRAPAAKALAVSAACLALAFALIPRPVPTPPAAPLSARVESVAPAPVVVAAAEPVAPVPRPVPRRPSALLTAPPAPLRVAHAVPAEPRPPAAVLVSEGTRNMPELAGIKLGDDLSAARVAQRISGATVLTDAPRPMLRPAAVEPASAALAPLSGPRPMLRPATPAAKTSALETPADPARPMPRPDGGAPSLAADTIAPRPAAAEPMRLASLTSTVSDATALSDAALVAAPPPEPRPDQPHLDQRRVAPKVVHATPRRIRPVPVEQAAAPLAPRVTTAPQPVALVVQPAPQAAGVVHPAPQVGAPRQVARVVQPPQPTRQPARTALTFQATSAATGLQRGSYALLGVFGSSDERHALVRLPSGVVRRVHVGDTVQGAQVAAVASDSVRLTGGGRDMVLKLE